MIESRFQHLLDNFKANKPQSRKALSQYLDVRWNYNTKSYMKLIQKAKNLGLNLVAIDMDITKRPTETELFPVNPWISKVRKAREAHMSKVLCRLRQERTIVIIGSFHTFDEFLPSALRNECLLPSSPVVIKSILNN